MEWDIKTDRQTDKGGGGETQKEQAEKKSLCVENRKCKIVRNNTFIHKYKLYSTSSLNFLPLTSVTFTTAILTTWLFYVGQWWFQNLYSLDMIIKIVFFVFWAVSCVFSFKVWKSANTWKSGNSSCEKSFIFTKKGWKIEFSTYITVGKSFQRKTILGWTFLLCFQRIQNQHQFLRFVVTVLNIYKQLFVLSD